MKQRDSLPSLHFHMTLSYHLHKFPAGKNEMGAGGLDPAGTNAIFLFGGSIDRLDLLIVLSMASAAFRLASFLDLPLPVHNKVPTVTVVSNVL